ncbi:ComEC/Rec2 family competence protein [Devosia sp. YIM 151766]|uniref:ComEC/Rec2 family competence protein n=1 Tax=Devosia sp. YIM 151766 TaxID=3017325 RepID=UPI00255C5A17|nr:ComEC/Rec2 family competence protein [Devosia sp. YIM 151766]WIY54303.1 ComEC/Rec2 family competence protein [Devosia sp. YIM 151766]
MGPDQSARRHWPPLAGGANPLLRMAVSFTDAFAGAAAYRRLFVLLPFSMIAGLIVYAILADEPGWLALAAGGVLGCALLAGAAYFKSLAAMRLAVQFAAFWLGFCLLPAHALLFGTQMLAFPAYGTFEAQVDAVLSADDSRQRILVSQLTPQDGARPVDIRRARLSLPSEPELRPGDHLRAALRLAPVPGPVLPGSHDGQFHSYFIGVGAYGSATGAVERIRLGNDADFARQVQGLRSYIAGRIDLALDGPSAAIGKSMVMGDQSDIDDDTRDVMAASGLAHIYSISGLHLSIVAGGIYWLVRLLLAFIPALVAWPVKQIAAMVGIVAAFLYLLLAGGVDNVPAFRSTLMLALVFGAVLAGRRALTMRNVAIAAILIILIDPASVFRPSFQLSFAAVVALIGVYETPRKRDGAKTKLERLGHLVAATAWTSFIAGLATLLFSAYHFQQTAPLSVLGNVMALPFVGLIMWAGVAAMLVMPLGLDGLCFQLMGWGIDGMLLIAELVAGWSEGLTGNPLLADWTLVAGLAALAWFAFLTTRWRLLAPVLLVPAILAFGLEPRPDVLIADTTQAVAIRDGDGMGLASGRTGSFAVNVWSRHYQTEIARTHSGAVCDGIGCIVQTPDYSIAIVRNAAAFAEDCGRHDLLIARIRPPNSCAAGNGLIGPSQLAGGGVHWLHWNASAGRFDIRPAMVNLNRPWRVAPRL